MEELLRRTGEGEERIARNGLARRDELLALFLNFGGVGATRAGYGASPSTEWSYEDEEGVDSDGSLAGVDPTFQPKMENPIAR